MVIILLCLQQKNSESEVMILKWTECLWNRHPGAHFGYQLSAAKQHSQHYINENKINWWLTDIWL